MKVNSNYMLKILLLLFIIFDIQIPTFISNFTQSIFGYVFIFSLAVSAFSIDKITGTLALVSTYVLFTRSITYVPQNNDDFIPTEKKKQEFFENSLNNSFPKTLEEQTVNNMIPLVKDSPIIDQQFIPTVENGYDAGKY
tara:strand:- start:579 stop:995 length:417 start_codon:yes stop_codon:yes gene_type:complete